MNKDQEKKLISIYGRDYEYTDIPALWRVGSYTRQKFDLFEKRIAKIWRDAPEWIFEEDKEEIRQEVKGLVSFDKSISNLIDKSIYGK